MSAYSVTLDTIRKVLNNLKIRILIIVQPKLISVKKIDTHVGTFDFFSSISSICYTALTSLEPLR